MRVVMMIEGQEGVTWDQWVALARGAEEARLDGLFRSDHYTSFHGFGGGALDAWTTLAGLAPLTQTLRLGTLVSPVTFRPPSLMARIVASVDHMSGGRAEVGLGTGWNDGEHRQNGFPFPDMGSRTRLLAEQVEIIVQSWRGEPFDHAGEAYSLEGQTALPKPVQAPHPPIVIGGQGGPRSIALAAKFGAEYNAFGSTPEDSAALRAKLDAACAKVGRDPATLALSIMVMAVLGKTDEDAQGRADRIAARLAPGGMLAGAMGFIKGSGRIASAEQLAERLRPFEKAGASRVYVQNFDFADPDSVPHYGALARALA
jgi:alkanesulfonate monooxygenase SsuD/methylene tetrahydromethanopterin reductase-like flavin-dependent oxidoreductase (luciferase family)